MNDHRHRVEQFHEVEQNVAQFHRDLANNPALVAKLSQFRHWYYLPQQDRFGPSKYIGYKDMDFTTYLLNFAKKMDGGRSEKALVKWFDVLAPDSTAELFLFDKLRDFVESHGKTLNVRAEIHVPIDCTEADLLSDWSQQMTEENIRRFVGRFRPEEIAGRAIAISHFNKKTPRGRTETMSVTRYRRDPFITEYAKIQANGICQLCEQPAPFQDEKGHPYLETHHIVWLAKGGLDTVDNTVALCANCHRKMHVLDLQEDREKLQRKVSESQYVSQLRC